MNETVWTSRRAFLRAGARGWTPGRLRVSDVAVRFTAHDGTTTEVPLAALTAVRTTRFPRRVLVLETVGGPIRLRCFAMPAIAVLLTSHGSGPIRDAPTRQRPIDGVSEIPPDP